jgi:hypothetical protein
MLQQINQFLQNLPVRHTEKSDPRMELKRDESQQQGDKKRGQGQEELKALPWEEIAIVSLPSLLAFIQSLLFGSAHASDAAKSSASSSPSHSPYAKASSAYKSHNPAAQMSAPIEQRPIEPPPSENQSSVTLDTSFGAEERERLERILNSLRSLGVKGVSEIAIERSENFLDGLEKAIKLLENCNE